MKNILFFSLLTILFFACSNDDDNLPESINKLGQSYYPLEIGQIKIFQADSIIYDDFNNSIDTLSFFRKEELVDTFTNTSGEKVFISRLSFRFADTLPWIVQKDFIQKRSIQRAVLAVDNLIQVPLTFPIAKNKIWDLNALNTRAEQNLRYREVFVPFQREGVQYDSAVIVLHRDEENLIERFFTEEVYAPRRGLVYRKDIALDTELDGEIRKGFEASLLLIEFSP